MLLAFGDKHMVCCRMDLRVWETQLTSGQTESGWPMATWIHIVENHDIGSQVLEQFPAVHKLAPEIQAQL